MKQHCFFLVWWPVHAHSHTLDLASNESLWLIRFCKNRNRVNNGRQQTKLSQFRVTTRALVTVALSQPRPIIIINNFWNALGTMNSVMFCDFHAHGVKRLSPEVTCSQHAGNSEQITDHDLGWKPRREEWEPQLVWVMAGGRQKYTSAGYAKGVSQGRATKANRFVPRRDTQGAKQSIISVLHWPWCDGVTSTWQEAKPEEPPQHNPSFKEGWGKSHQAQLFLEMIIKWKLLQIITYPPISFEVLRSCHSSLHSPICGLDYLLRWKTFVKDTINLPKYQKFLFFVNKLITISHRKWWTQTVIPCRSTRLQS